MFRRLFVFVFAAWAGLASTTLIVPAETAFPPGLRIGLDPPGDMKLSTRLPGFEDTERNAVIAILDLPASAYRDLENSAFSLTQQGLDQLKRESFPFENGIGFLISGVAQQNGGKVHRWSLLAMAIGQSVPDLTMLVNVEVPESALSVYSDSVVRKALASVTFRPAPITEQLSLLPFKLGDLSGFQVMQVMPAGTVILADGPPDNNERKPFMIVSIDRGGPPEAADRAQFARNLLTTAPVRELSIQSSESMRVGGAPGHEIRANGKGPAGDSVSLVQWVRFSPGGFLRVIGVSPAEKWDQAFGRFRTVRDGIALR
ncbi:MAG TPA: hypothetical protein VI137_16615 [Pseudolabrys sp.]|jgi:hypothetical protein